MISVIKSIHILCALISIIGFTARGVLKLNWPEKLTSRWIRIVPHVVDTLLLASAITLVILTNQYPTTQPWVTAKITALIFYIGFGMITLRFGRTKTQVVFSFIAALLCYTYIVGVAVTRTVWPF